MVLFVCLPLLPPSSLFCPFSLCFSPAQQHLRCQCHVMQWIDVFGQRGTGSNGLMPLGNVGMARPKPRVVPEERKEGRKDSKEGRTGMGTEMTYCTQYSLGHLILICPYTPFASNYPSLCAFSFFSFSPRLAMMPSLLVLK